MRNKYWIGWWSCFIIFIFDFGLLKCSIFHPGQWATLWLVVFIARSLLLPSISPLFFYSQLRILITWDSSWNEAAHLYLPFHCHLYRPDRRMHRTRSYRAFLCSRLERGPPGPVERSHFCRVLQSHPCRIRARGRRWSRSTRHRLERHRCQLRLLPQLQLTRHRRCRRRGFKLVLLARLPGLPLGRDEFALAAAFVAAEGTSIAIAFRQSNSWKRPCSLS